MKIKKIMSMLLTCMLVAGCMLGCGNEDIGSDRRDRGGRDSGRDYTATATTDPYTTSNTGGNIGGGGDTFTLMVYMCGADLESQHGCASNDISEMLEAGYSDGVNVIVQTGGASYWYNDDIDAYSVQRFEVSDTGLNLVDDIGLVNMLEPSTLTDFVQFAASNYPADRYGLILWDHGGGTMSGYGVDENYPDDDGLSIADIGDALQRSGTHFAFVGFDACLMATVETMDAMEDCADYMIASEETEAGTGWYYTNFINELSSNPGISVPELGEIIVDDFLDDSYSDVDDGATLSVINLAYSDELESALINFMSEGVGLLESGNYATVAQARTSCRSFGDDEFEQIDIADYVSILGTSGSDEVLSAVEDAVVYSGSNLSGTSGIAMYFPYYYPESHSDVLNVIDGSDFDSTAYEEFFDTFVSILYYGQSSGGGTQNPYGYEEDDDYSYYSEDWYNDDVSDYYDDYYYVDDSELELTDKGDHWALELSDDDWDIVTKLWLQAYIDDGEGYIELGYDDTYEFDSDGDLIVGFDNTWLWIDDCIVPFYAEDYGDYADGTSYTYGYIPAVLNDEEEIEIIVYWYSTNSSEPVIKGYRYPSDGTQMSSRSYYQLEKGDVIDFYFAYYTYDGEYEASYTLSNNTLYYDGSDLDIYYGDIWDTPVEICFYIQDVYQNNYWTETLRYE